MYWSLKQSKLHCCSKNVEGEMDFRGMYCAVLTARYFIIMIFVFLLVRVQWCFNCVFCSSALNLAKKKHPYKLQIVIPCFEFVWLIFPGTLTFPPFWFSCSTHVVSAAILKVRMEQVAELVLIATRRECRKKVRMNSSHTQRSERCQLSYVKTICMFHFS